MEKCFIYKTKDLEEAAFFWVQEKAELSKIETVERINKKTVWFVFCFDMLENDFNDLKLNYMNGKTLVEPRKYARARADLKSFIREKTIR